MSIIKANPRLVVIIALAAAILLVFVFATGGVSTSGNSAPSAGSTTAAQPAAPTGKHVQGKVSVQVTHVSGHAWRFSYLVTDTGKYPLAGFQINAPASNLYHISKRPGWSAYGSGVCSGSVTGVLVYWSTGPRSRTLIQPGSTASFAFSVNTTGPSDASYSLSLGSYQPWFGTTRAPAPSSLPATVTCQG